MTKSAFSKKKTIVTSKLYLDLRKKLVKCYFWNIALYGVEKRWRRTVGPIMCEIKWYKESRRTGISDIQKEEEVISGLAASCVRTAFKHTIFKER